MAAAEAARPTLGNVDAPAKAGNRKKFAKREQQRTDKCKDAAYVDTKMSQRILEQARAQMEELEEEEQYHDHGVRRAMPALDANVAYLDESASDDEDGEMDGDNAAFGASDDDADDFANDTDFAAFAELDDDVDREMGALSRQDRDALAAFMSERPPERRSLADIIMEKFKEQSERAVEEEGDGHQKQGGAAFVPPGLNEKVVQVYQK